MEESETPQKNSEKVLSKKKKFKIRRRKSFIDEKGENTLKIWKNKELLNNNTLSKNKSLFQQKKSLIPNKRRSSFFFSVLNYKNIEEEIKHVILEMRRACLWDLRKQSYELNLIESENEDDKKGNLPGKFSSKLLYNHSINDKNLEKANSKRKHYSKTLILNKRDFIKQICSNNEENETKAVNNNNLNEIKPKSSSSQSITKINKIKNKKTTVDKFRFYYRGGLISDSNDENESEEEPEIFGCLINQDNNIIFIYDLLIAFFVFYCLLYIPYELANSFCICNNFFNSIVTLNTFIDILFAFDLIINFFLEYQMKEEKIIIQINLKAISHYFLGWFFIDLLASFPINIICFRYCRNYQNLTCHTYEIGSKMNIFPILRCLKSIKIFKIFSRKKNQFISKINEKCSDNIILDNIFYVLNKILFVLIGLHLISCIYIFIGKHTFPGWIFKNEFQNTSFWKLYIISIYHITMTLTTVGYGDIYPDSLIEIIFRVILLAVGIVGYSWLISSISNGINKENFASINFSNECQILEEIRMDNKKIPYGLYLSIINHLKQKHFYQKKYDKNLLFNTLPYSLKNNLIVSMYKYQIDHFDFFKNISNSNFLVDALSYFSPISALKYDILLRENDLIEEIFFVNEGKLSLEISIDIFNPEESINKYLSNDFLDLTFEFDLNTSNEQIRKHSKTTTFIQNQTNLTNTIIKKEAKLISKNVYLKIHDIHKNEDFGGFFMFFGKRSPFALRVKSKRAKLFVIKKSDFIKLSNQYKNILNSIHKKKKHNFNIIKNIMIKTIFKFCNIKGIKINEKYEDNIRKAINELNKEMIPHDIIKNVKFESDINEIDDEINKTIEDFDKQLSHLNCEITINQRSKIFGNIKKVKSSNIKFKHFLVEDLNSSNESRYYSSCLKNKRKKKKHKKKNKPIIKSNVPLNTDLDKIDFNFSESGESIKTVEIKGEKNEASEIGPNTIQILPKSLIKLIKNKIKNQNSLNTKGQPSQEENIFICINNNYNYGNNIKNINNNNLINSTENYNNKKSKNSSNVTFDNILDNKISEFTYNFKKKGENKKPKKSSLSNISLFQIKKDNCSLGSNSRDNLINNNNNKFFNSQNLSSTSVDSFEIKRSYKNINQVTDGEYIKNNKFQDNAIKYIKSYKMNYCNKKIVEIKEENKIKSDSEIKKVIRLKKKGKSKHKKNSKKKKLVSKNIIKSNKIYKNNLSTINNNKSTKKDTSYNSNSDHYNINNTNNVNININGYNLDANKYHTNLKKTI